MRTVEVMGKREALCGESTEAYDPSWSLGTFIFGPDARE